MADPKPPPGAIAHFVAHPEALRPDPSGKIDAWTSTDGTSTFANEPAYYQELSLDEIREAVESLPPMPPPNYYVGERIWAAAVKAAAEACRYPTDEHVPEGELRFQGFGVRRHRWLTPESVVPADHRWKPVDPDERSAHVAACLRALAGIVAPSDGG